MTVLETPVCDITTPLIMLCNDNYSKIEKDEQGISLSFTFESLLCWSSLPSDAIAALLQEYFFVVRALLITGKLHVCVTF